MLAVLVVAVALAAYGTPARASGAALAAAIRSGDVRAIATVYGGDRYGLEMFPERESGLSRTSSGQMVLWTSSTGRLYRTQLDWPVDSTGADSTSVDLARTIDATARAARVSAPSIGASAMRWWTRLGLPLAVLEVAAFLLLVVGPQPRRKTKWGTFWSFGLPAGLGVAWWVLRDAPWNSTMIRVPAPAPRVRGLLPSGIRRMGGGAAFLGLSVLLGSLLSAGLFGLLAYGDRQNPPAGSVTWSVVRTDGTTTTVSE